MDKNYIKQLQAILVAGSFTQEVLAGRLNVTFAALSRWLHGYAIPHPSRLAQIEKLYRELAEYPSFTDPAIRHIVSQVAFFRDKQLWKKIQTNPKMQEDLLLEHTYNSTSIEGTTFNKRQTEAVLFNKMIVANKTLLEHLEVTNHAAVLRNLFQKKYKTIVNEDLIKNLHRDLMQGVRHDAGDYSLHQRGIRGLDIHLTHPKDIPEEMSLLIIQWHKIRSKNLKHLADFHTHFELIHPFGDGNGRVGRLIMILQCLQLGYPPIIIENARKEEYYDVLAYAQTKAVGPFVNFLFEEMQMTSKILKKYGVAG